MAVAMTSDDILRNMIGDLILQIALLRGRVAQLEADQAAVSEKAPYEGPMGPDIKANGAETQP